MAKYSRNPKSRKARKAKRNVGDPNHLDSNPNDGPTTKKVR